MGRTYEAKEPRYVKGDRVWVLRGGGVREPGVVIGHYVRWDSYRVVYTADLIDRGPKAIEEWRLSFRRKGEEHWRAEPPARATAETLTSEG
jgi:hypothetical protein